MDDDQTVESPQTVLGNSLKEESEIDKKNDTNSVKELSKIQKLARRASDLARNTKSIKSSRKKRSSVDSSSISEGQVLDSSRIKQEAGLQSLLTSISEHKIADDFTQKENKIENEANDDKSDSGVNADTENHIPNDDLTILPQPSERPRKSLSTISYVSTAQESDSAIVPSLSEEKMTSSLISSHPTTSGLSRNSKLEPSIRRGNFVLRRTSTSQSIPVGDANSGLLKMAFNKEWSQLELSLRYMPKSDPDLYAVDDDTGINPFMLAVRDNRIAVVERLIEMGVNINDRARDGQSAIHYAVANGRDEIVNILIKKKADMAVKGGEKQQLPLHIACSRSGNNAVSIMQSVVRATNKNLRIVPDKDGYIPLFLAIDSNNQSAYRDLSSHCADEQLRYQDPTAGNTALHMACERRDSEMVRFLCKKGALVNVQNKQGTTALHIASSMGDILIIECLYSHKADPDLLDRADRTPIHVAAEKGHTSVVELLADKFPASVLRRTQDGSTLMHIASEHGHPDTALAFLKKGVPLHMPNKSGAVCLHSAAKNNHVDVVRTLLIKGAHVDCRTKDKLTALHVAVQHCRPLVVQMLLGFGAPVQIKGGEKQETPLHLAAQITNGEQVAEMLIKSGADANAAREGGETAVHMSSRKGNLSTLKLLLAEGGDCRTQSEAGENGLHVAVRYCMWDVIEYMLEFLEKKFSRYEATMCVNMENKEGETPLHLAAELTKERAHFDGEDLKILSILLQYGGDVNFTTKLTQETSLHYCARAGNHFALRTLLEHIGHNNEKMPSIINRQAKNGWSPLLFASDEGHSECVDVLLQHSARVDVFDENGKAALHLAAENGHNVIADMLIRKKAFVNAKTKLGLTPLHLAAQRGYNNLVALLIKPVGSDQKASIDALSLDKKTPLHKASEDGKIDVCRTLLDADADVEAADNDGQTPLHLAAENDHSSVVKMFLAHRSDLVTTANKNGATCAHIAASKGSVAVIKELLNSNKESVTTATDSTSNATALHLAASRGHAEVVRELILNGANLTDEDSDGMNALHLSAKYGHINIIEVIVRSKTAIQENTGLPLQNLWKSVSKKTGFNALHVAAQSGKEDFAREMLHRIRAAESSDLPGVKIDGAKETARDYGFTPLHLASHSGHVNLVRMILNYPGVSVDACTAVQKLTPLHLAAKSGYVAVVGLLLSKSINQLSCADAKGYTCLHYAAINGHLDMASLLLGQGTHIESCDKNGLTPLHLAAKSGSLKMVKLLTEAGASTAQETKLDKRIPIQFAALSRHSNVVSYLLQSEHDTYKLIDDKMFVCDLMLVAKAPIYSKGKSQPTESPSFVFRPSSAKEASQTKNIDILEEFILSSSAPIDTAVKLSRAFVLSSNREKEQAKNLLECASYCENLAVDLLEICSAANGANDILKATDNKSNPFLDVLIECEQKNVIAHPAVQKYLSDVWVGGLELADWKLVLLFFALLIMPILWLILALPLPLRFSQIPIIKFMVYLVSHFYLVTIFVVTVAVPLTPIYDQADLIPQWNEWLLLVWISGVLVNEIINPGKRTGIAKIRVVVLIFCAIAVIVHLVALAFPYSETDPVIINQRLEIIYIRNLFLSTAMTCAFVQFLEFLSFHYLFGPWSIIIEGLVNDLIKFGVIVLMFIVAFTMWLAAVYQPVYVYETNVTAIVGTGEGAGGARVLNPLDTFQILFFALFGLIEPDNLPPINRNPLVTIYLIQIVFGLYHVVTLIVLINLLIAMMSDTYQRIQAQSDTEWKFGRAKLIRNMKKTSLSPAPVNLFVTLYRITRLCAKHKGRACDVSLCYIDDDELDNTFDTDGGEVIMNHNQARRDSTIQEMSDANSPDLMQQEVTNRRYHLESGKRRMNLEYVVDWTKIKQKYWMRKGKQQQSTSDLLSPLRRDEVNNGRDSASRDHHVSIKHHSDENRNGISKGLMTSITSPHSVPYDGDITR